MTTKPKLTKAQADWLFAIGYATRAPDATNKPATTEVLILAGLVEVFDRKPNAYVTVQSLRLTELGRAAVNKAEG